ncbi:histidine phosphatase family protein, partial [Planococcus sp. MB-3u-09]|uniref:histidine phosphatase family protein n=2 Tax=Planococcus TaxID=1372 RepID=UPI000CB9A216
IDVDSISFIKKTKRNSKRMLDKYLNLKYTDVYLVRHADFNNKHLTGGWTDSDISESGKAQSMALGNHLRENLKIDAFYCSTLLRATHTAEIIAKYLNLPLFYVAEFRTINNGVLKNRNQAEVKKMKIEKFIEDPEYCIPGGESYHNFEMRVKKIFEDTILQNKEKSVLIITHARVIQTILKQILQQSDDSKVRFGVYPTGVTNVRVYNNQSILISKINDTNHLTSDLMVSDVE